MTYNTLSFLNPIQNALSPCPSFLPIYSSPAVEGVRRESIVTLEMICDYFFYFFPGKVYEREEEQKSMNRTSYACLQLLSMDGGKLLFLNIFPICPICFYLLIRIHQRVSFVVVELRFLWLNLKKIINKS